MLLHRKTCRIGFVDTQVASLMPSSRALASVSLTGGRVAVTAVFAGDTVADVAGPLRRKSVSR